LTFLAVVFLGRFRHTFKLFNICWSREVDIIILKWSWALWRHFPKVWARGEPYWSISGRCCENEKKTGFEYIHKLLNGTFMFDFVIGAQSEKVYAKDAWGMPLPNAYGYWVFISYHRCKSIGIELPPKYPWFHFSISGKRCNRVRGLEPKSLCRLIILRPVLGLTPILFERFPETLQQITPPSWGVFCCDIFRKCWNKIQENSLIFLCQKQV